MTAPKKILVVDDNEEVRSIYKLALEGAEYEVKTVASRNDAQDCIVNGWIPELMMVDFRMPGESLSSFLEFIRSRPGLKDTKVIALSSFSKSDPAIKESGLHIPFFQKPAGLDELLAIVRRALES